MQITVLRSDSGSRLDLVTELEVAPGVGAVHRPQRSRSAIRVAGGGETHPVVRHDLRQGLVTLPILCYLERVADDGPVNTVLSGQRDEEHVRAAIEAVSSSGAIELALAEARAHAWRSQEALATLPDGVSRQMLYSLAEYVVERRR